MIVDAEAEADRFVECARTGRDLAVVGEVQEVVAVGGRIVDVAVRQPERRIADGKSPAEREIVDAHVAVGDQNAPAPDLERGVEDEGEIVGDVENLVGRRGGIGSDLDARIRGARAAKELGEFVKRGAARLGHEVPSDVKAVSVG
jgi:hypothetical protein